jgi:hypothetical protein
MTRDSKLVPFGVIAGLVLAGTGFRFEVGWIQASGILLAGVGAAAGMVDTYRVGIIETNWGTTRRAESPVRFQFEAAFWSAFITIWTIGGMLVSLGIIGHKK